MNSFLTFPFKAILGFVLVLSSGPMLQAESSPTAPVVTTPTVLTLAECYKLAAVRSDTLQLSQADIDAANARYYEAIAALFPNIHFQSQQSFTNKGGSSFTGGRVVAGRDYSSQNSLTVTAPIFDGFQNYNNVAANEATRQSKTFTLARVYQTLYQDVASAFYQVVSNENDLIILADQVRAQSGRVEELERRVKLGRSRPAETLQAKSDLAQTKVTIEQVKGLRNAAREALAFFIGRKAATLALKDEITLPSAVDLEKYLTLTGTRPDILAALQDQRAARRQLSAAKGQLLPSVTASGSYYLSEDPSTTREYAFTFSIELPLFDGGMIYNKIKEQKALTRSSEIKIEQLRKTVDQNIRTTFTDFNASVAQLAQLRESVEIETENYQLQQEDYKRGVVSNLDVLTALTQLVNSRRTLQQTEITARLNLVKLHVAAGSIQ